MEPEDFTNRKFFPGTTGNPFDVVLHRYTQLQQIPSLLFAVLLFILALIPTSPRIWLAPIYWSFFLLDWFMLAMLPKAGVSYGSAKPTVLLLVIFRLPFAFLPLPFSLILQVIGSLLVVYGFWIEPRRIRISHEKLQSPKLPSDFNLKVLHLGDLHVERITSRERRVNELIKDLKPDLILFSGDFLNLSYLSDARARQDLVEIIQHWEAPLGVFAVTGSPAVDLPGSIPPLLVDTSIHLLQDELIPLKWQGVDLDLIGLSCSHKPFEDFPRLQNLIAGKPDRFTLLLYHSPDLAPDAAGFNIDLQLSGHTHGGQVRLPFLGALYTGSLYGRRFDSGRYQLKNLVLYITRGIGLEGAAAPRVRFLCPPEVILWQISGSHE